MSARVQNWDAEAARRYHEATKHSYESVYRSQFTLDWANQPLPYKLYTSLPPLPLPSPRDLPPSPLLLLEAIARTGDGLGGMHLPDLATLARLCFYANGVTKRLRYPGGVMHFRAAACTGALYHVELYLACADLPDLEAGLYHYGAHDHALRRLRAGDYRDVLVRATGAEPAVALAPVVVISTSTFWRNAWKYQARAYRHTFWDTGTVLANLLAVAAAQELPARLVLGFADEAVNRLLDVDARREAAVSLVALGRTGAPPPAPPLAPLHLPVQPLSAREVRYSLIEMAHAASSLASGADAAAWRGQAARALTPGPPSPASLRSAPSPASGRGDGGEGRAEGTGRGQGVGAGPLVPLTPLPPAALPSDPPEPVIRRRGSARRFARRPITAAQFATMLDRATRGVPADCLSDTGLALNDVYLIVHAVDGLAPGAYVFHPGELGADAGAVGALERLKSGEFRAAAGELALGQELAADAAVNVYFLCDLEPVLARFGNRGYRAAQLEAAITAGRLYLAAYALGLGATGLTFFDDDVTAFFAPHAAGKSVMFLIALGHPLRGGLP